MPSAIRLSDAVDEYLAVCKAQGQAKTTISNMRSTLTRFLTVVGNIYPRNLGPQHVDALLVEYGHWEPSTRKATMLRLSVFQKWLHARKYLPRDVDILEGKRKLKVPKKRKPRIKADQFDIMLDKAPSGRDRVLLAVGLYTLLRSSEMKTLQWRHVDLDDNWIDVYRHKTGEADRLPILGELHEELMRWRVALCREHSVIAPDPDWYVICRLSPGRHRNAKGQFGGTPSGAKTWPSEPLLMPIDRIKELLANIGITEKGTGMHTLRRSGGQALLEAIESGKHDESAIRAVQSMYGHKNIATTEMYLDRDVDKARRDSLLRGKRLYGEHTAGAVVPLRAKEASGGSEEGGVL